MGNREVCILKYFIRYFWYILAVIVLIGHYVYTVSVIDHKTYKDFNGMKGTVLYTVETSRGISFPTVSLANGMSRTINGGYRPYKSGEEFINNVSYSPVFGIVGMGSCVLPQRYYSPFSIILHVLEAIFIAVIISSVIYISVVTLLGAWDRLVSLIYKEE